MKRALEAAEIAAQVLLRRQHEGALDAAARGACQLLAHARRHRRGGGPDLDQRRFHRGLQARFRTIHL